MRNIPMLASMLLMMTTPALRAETCPEAIEKLKAEDFLKKEFKWKAPSVKEGEEAPPLPELDCKSSGPLSMAGKAAPVHQVGLKGQKKRIAIVVPEGGEPLILRGEPRALESTNHKAFAAALPLAKDLTTWRKATVTDFEIKNGDLCARTSGAEGVIKGTAVTCLRSAKKTDVTTPISLGAGILTPTQAQQVALKEFARIEKEEEVPDAKEIFGDKDTVWKLSLGADAKSSYYVFWMSQFSASGVIVMMARMDGTTEADVVANAFEYDPKLVAAKVAKWQKAGK